ncbi:MAG: hypothetical protein JW728_00300, partial [Candidatus Aureabacteria bacterium]|nr:hypothetical protein [Candidatus Auribacterota bacterium]
MVGLRDRSAGKYLILAWCLFVFPFCGAYAQQNWVSEGGVVDPLKEDQRVKEAREKLTESENLYGANDPVVAGNLFRLASIYYEYGRYD